MNDAKLDEVRGRAPVWSRLDTVALILVVVVAAVVRLTGLAHPDELIFDETYYAKDACWYVNSSEAQCARGADAPEVHPPLGKWLIGVGIRIFGFDCPDPDNDIYCKGTSTSFAWRIVPAIAGIATVAVMYLLARRLFRSTLAASLAAGLLAFDFLHLVQSRTSMLDIFIPLFGLAGFYFLVLDRDQMRADDASVWDRPWRLAAGAAFGAAVATKWSGGLLMLGGLILVVAWSLAARSELPWRQRIAAVFRSEAATIFVFLLVVPFLLYSLTYIGRFSGTHVAGAPWKQGHVVRTMWDHHHYMWDFHSNLESTHSYQSPGASWIALKRPVSYYFCSGETCRPSNNGEYEEIMATGNPFVWWMSVPALVFVAYRWIRRRNFMGAEGLVLTGFLVTYVPWLVVDRPALFLFYLLPTVPFMCLALAYVATKIGQSWEAKSAIALFCLGTLGVFAFYRPVLVGKPLPQPQWDSRIWVFDNCDKPTGGPVTATVTETIEGQVTTRVTETTSDTSGMPPEGWCWI
ncbi:MAG TPA: phospholipid carrier-dependent glycosyltransferase [Actinomycetota bacterium]|nr:phospholipid carrier-dependent glycosyltransferase [Actinomycetota bacterium]